MVNLLRTFSEMKYTLLNDTSRQLTYIITHRNWRRDFAAREELLRDRETNIGF